MLDFVKNSGEGSVLNRRKVCQKINCQKLGRWVDASLTTCLFTIFTLQLYNSDIDVNIDEEELALYLAVTVDRKKLEDLDLGDVVHTRIKSGGRNPGITTKEILKRSEKEKTPSLFHLPVRKPTTDESRKMLSLSIEIAIKAAMSEHMYSFNGQIRKQETGGAIGNVFHRSSGSSVHVVLDKNLLEKT